MAAFGSGIVVILQGEAAIIEGVYVNPPAPTKGVIYISKGERWDTIAYKMYGDATLISSLILYNPGIAAIDYVAEGVGVFVPLLAPAPNTSTSTPWG